MFLLLCKYIPLYPDAWIMTIVWQQSKEYASLDFNIKIILYQLKKQTLSTFAHINMSVNNTPHTRVIRRRRRGRKFATLFKCLIKAFCCSYGGNEFLMLSSPIRWFLWWFWLKIRKKQHQNIFLIKIYF